VFPAGRLGAELAFELSNFPAIVTGFVGLLVAVVLTLACAVAALLSLEMLGMPRLPAAVRQARERAQAARSRRPASQTDAPESSAPA